MYIIIILIVFIAAVFILKKRVDYTNENVLEELEANTDHMPTRAIVKTDILFRILDRDMMVGRMNSIVFYYKQEKHIMGVEMYNDKLVLRYDDKLYASTNEMKNVAVINGHRVADLNDPVTITDILYKDTKISAILENDQLLKDGIVTGDNKLYDLNIKFDEIK